MLNNVLDAVVRRLTAAGLQAGKAWPKTAAGGGTVLRVGVARAEDCGGGFSRYLGTLEDGETDGREIYGLRCALGLSLDIYAPLSADDPAGDCLAAFDAAADCIGAMGGGFQVKALRCGAPAPDRESGMMRLRGEAEGSALLVAPEGDGQSGTFCDFVLRGELSV